MTQLRGAVHDLSHDGRGVVKVEGKVYFVEGALPGEEIAFTRQKRRRRHETGSLDEIISRSPQRADPECEYFGVCGGCALQHLDARAQLDYKHRTLLENLERIGRVSAKTILEPLSGPVRGYRRKARLGIRYVPKKGGVLVGFRERHKSYITSLDQCIALHPAISNLLPSLHELVAGLSCFDRIPQIEVARAEQTTALVFRHLEPLTQDDLELLRKYETRHGVAVYLQPGGLDTVRLLSPGNSWELHYHLADQTLNLYFEPTDFLQVNGEMNQLLINRAMELLQPNPDDSILELFCGLGNFSLPIAQQAGRVVSIESNQDLVTRARDNAQRNSVANAEFVVADLYTENVADIGNTGPYDKLFLDPPRSGAMEVVRDLVPVIKPQRIVYVSCNPATLARDSEVLCRKLGYEMTHCGVIDMFPHTAHVESIAVFELH